jgi:hypothetical protein
MKDGVTDDGVVNARPPAAAVTALAAFLGGVSLGPEDRVLVARELLGVQAVDHAAPFEILSQGAWGLIEFDGARYQGGGAVVLRIAPARMFAATRTWLLTTAELERLLVRAREMER